MAKLAVGRFSPLIIQLWSSYTRREKLKTENQAWPLRSVPACWMLDELVCASMTVIEKPVIAITALLRKEKRFAKRTQWNAAKKDERRNQWNNIANPSLRWSSLPVNFSFHPSPRERPLSFRGVGRRRIFGPLSLRRGRSRLRTPAYFNDCLAWGPSACSVHPQLASLTGQHRLGLCHDLVNRYGQLSWQGRTTAHGQAKRQWYRWTYSHRPSERWAGHSIRRLESR